MNEALLRSLANNVPSHGQFVNANNRVDGNSNTKNARTPLFQCPGYTGVFTLNEYADPGFNKDRGDNLSLFLQYLGQEIITRNTVLPVCSTFLRPLLSTRTYS